MSWLQLEVSVSRDRVEAMEARLFELGALSVTFTDPADEPILEPGVGETPLWPEVVVTGLFSAETDAAMLKRALESTGQSPAAEVSKLEDRDWSRAWMDDFKAMQFGDRVWVVPGGFAVPEGAETVVRLDPGLAFGSGTHPTTRMCLEWLDRQTLEGSRVLDFGCGSGILSVAAALLGASSVTAVDNDPQALTATRINAANNGAAETVAAVMPRDLGPGSYDFVMANILAGTLIALSPDLAQACAAGGKLAISGILSDQVPDVRAHYEPWFTGIRVHRLEEWALIEGTRNDSN